MKRALQKSKSDGLSGSWKKPDEVIKLQRIKQKQRALQQRFIAPQVRNVLK